MTRKDYILLAEALQAAAYALNPPERTGALLAANEIAHRLKQDNPASSGSASSRRAD
jgi:hypothetical protein